MDSNERYHDNRMRNNTILLILLWKVLAFYSQLPDVEMELFDYTEADKNLETINLELDKLVKDAKTSTRRRK